ncbi:hypothetical protein GN956_G8429 [Arapaima gigas]
MLRGETGTRTLQNPEPQNPEPAFQSRPGGFRGALGGRFSPLLGHGEWTISPKDEGRVPPSVSVRVLRIPPWRGSSRMLHDPPPPQCLLPRGGGDVKLAAVKPML